MIRKKDKDGIARITPVNPMLSTLFTNKAETGIYVPLFLSEVGKAYAQCRDKMNNRKPAYDFHKPEDIALMLKTLTLSLTDNKRFTAVAPQFHTGSRIYSLSNAGSLNIEEDTTWVQRLPYYSISHNVSPADKALGAGGCKDCHSEDSHLFNGPVVTDYFGDNGKPVTVSMAQFLDLPSSFQTWNKMFGAFLTAGPLILMTREMGVFTSLQKTVMDNSFFLGLFLMLLVAAGYAWLVHKMIQNIILSAGLYGIGIMTAGTGLFLWIRPWPDSAILFFALEIHAVFAGVTVLASVWIAFIKRL